MMEKIREVKNMELNHSNMQNECEHDLKKSIGSNFYKSISPNKKLI